MAIVDPETFEGKEVARVYIAGRLREAKRVEQTLTDHGVDYLVQIEPFKAYVLGILPTQYDGVAFYVLLTQADYSRQVLNAAGLTKGLLLEDAPPGS